MPSPNFHARAREQSRTPTSSGFAALESEHVPHRRAAWATSYLPLPSLSRRGHRQTIAIPIPPLITQAVTSLRRRPKWVYLLCGLLTVAFLWHLSTGSPLPFKSTSTTRVFVLQDIRRIWKWEVDSGHYQSSKKIPQELELEAPLLNPGLPPTIPISNSNSIGPSTTMTVGSGLKRTYINPQSVRPAVDYPPRPVPGSIADLDIVMEHCDFDQNKYVRDCLEVLRTGAGLDNGRRMRRGNIDEWKYIYVEEGEQLSMTAPPRSARVSISYEPGQLRLPPPRTYRTTSELFSTCDPDHPRIFHMFWGGPFTDKPYIMLLSFLFTQNLGLHNSPSTTTSNICHPQFWVWIQTGAPRDASPKATAREDMFDSLKKNPWSAPFLHPRLQDVIKFKLWNATQQLDGVHELKGEWRNCNLFNFGEPVTPMLKKEEESWHSESAVNDTTAHIHKLKRKEDPLHRLRSTSSSSSDPMRTILSDIARFVLCHHFGGIYIDVDTIFLRDWEELWGWKGAFAYRWSRIPYYNTAVLKLNKGSALGTFLLRTALKHDLDFHPKNAISTYVKDAHLEGLLLRLPDALFDPAWLTTENFQRSRPPSPYFTDFGHFFETPTRGIGEPQVAGFEGFFRGAFSYHWHNSWWKPCDSARNWPDLGQRFKATERIARLQLRPLSHIAKNSSNGALGDVNEKQEELVWEDSVADDKRDLDWATVMKRTFESYMRGERPNMYGEWIAW